MNDLTMLHKIEENNIDWKLGKVHWSVPHALVALLFLSVELHDLALYTGARRE